MLNPMHDEASKRTAVDTPTRLAPILLAIPAAWSVHAGLGTGRVVGLPWGEVWGRLYVTGQTARWLQGTPPGWADLLDAPAGRPFWPVDPLVQLVSVPLAAVLGAPTAWAVGLGLLIWLAGVGGYAAARSMGAPVAGALACGLLLEWNPYVLRHAAEGVTEAVAVGPLALAAAAAVRGRLGWFAATVALVCGTSPYHAIYGAVALLLAFPALDRQRWVRLVSIGLGVGIVFALPLLIAESGPDGRLAWSGGYGLAPERLVRIEADGLVPVPPPLVVTGGEVGRAGHSLVRQGLVGWPGGVAVTLVLLAGLVREHTRAVAAVALVWLGLGPGWAAAPHAAGVEASISPLAWALGALPGLDRLGNPIRLVVVPIVAATLVGGGLLARWPRAWPTVAAGALVVGMLELPPLALPSVDPETPTELFAAVDGPTSTFPSGDPPAWNPDARPKENLWLASLHGGAQGFDYGRGGIPGDLPLLVRLAEIGGVPIGETATTLAPATALWAHLREHGFTRVLIVRRTLSDRQYGAIRAWLVAEAGQPLIESDRGGVWAVPSR